MKTEFMFNFDDAHENGYRDALEGLTPEWEDRLTILGYTEGYNKARRRMGENEVYVKYNDDGSYEFV